MIAKNYQEEDIPDIQNLMADVLNSFEIWQHRKRYWFHELFKAHPSGYYEKQSSVFNEIGYNSTLNEKDSALNEIQGLYIFYEEEIPVYVGISRKLIRRLKNHFLGKSHFEASLAYLIARSKYDCEIEYFKKTRKEFPFQDYRETIQREMADKWRIEIIPESNNHKLYLLEFALACKLRAKWNSFATH